jgi:hypothetical protein
VLNYSTADMYKHRVVPTDLLSEPHDVHTVRYGVDAVGTFDTTWTTSITRSGQCAGVALWFTGHLMEGVTVGPGPDRPDTVYTGAALYFPQPVDVAAGTACDVSVRAHPTASGMDWTWSLTVAHDDGPPVRQSNSTMLSTVINSSVLQSLKPSRVPQVSLGMRRDQFILSQLVDGASVQQAADALINQPSLGVADRAEAIALALQTVNRYEPLGLIQ